ncbi:hypothetical protein RhiJN_17392 [Ceratobasidium sp. AG-Ba]|nr:hypothetical protein RhiJN_17392 [Ceratobasidium sp. AG-Ba]
MNFHRNAGKVINILTFISTLSAWGVAYVSFGGDMSIQGGSYALGIMTLWSTVKSWTAIRRLQIDEHRTWVIRSWSYQMSVITLRVLAVSLAIIISIVGGFYHSMPCKEVEFILNDKDLYALEYPQCQADWNGSPVTHVAVLADVTENDDLRRTAAFRAVFGLSTWAGFWIHAVVCEYYLFLTKDESDRLKMVSEKRQKARQMLNERQSTSQ